MSGKKYVMAFDQGTTSSRCILFDRQGNICSVAQKEFQQIYPQPGWVEHNPMEIWSSQLSVATEAVSKIGATGEDIAAIGITNQRETTIVWNRHTGEPVYNAIVWQCRRTADRVKRMQEDGIWDYVKETTGLVPDAYFSASKLAWILDNVEGARKEAEEGNLLFGTIDTWLIWNLTKGAVHVTDYTNASRTMMFDIHRLCWDERILAYFNIPKCMLPTVKASSCIYGYSETSVLGACIPISGVAGDQQAALFGQCCFEAGDVKNTYGTGCFLLMNTGEKAVTSQNGLLTTIAASLEGRIQYALEGSIFVAGAGIQWLRDEMKLLQDAGQSEAYALSVADTNGVYVVPAFTGLGAPYWNPYARGTVVGLTRGCKKEHFVRAVLEAMAYQTNDILGIMEQESGVDIAGLKVDGGASNNNFLMQFQSDILNVDVLRPKCVETTALGAAYLAGLAVGYWEDLEDIRKNWALSETFHPDMLKEKREKLLSGWKRAVKCALVWTEDET
ncbi:MAG: glycerol kinase GlpK [Lachnospiraceae bacterium]